LKTDEVDLDPSLQDTNSKIDNSSIFEWDSSALLDFQTPLIQNI